MDVGGELLQPVVRGHIGGCAVGDRVAMANQKWRGGPPEVPEILVDQSTL